MKLQERDLEIMLWLDLMGFSHLEQIRDIFFKGCKLYRAPYRRMLKLAKAGFVETRKVYSDPRDLYVLSYSGLAHLRSIGFQYVPALSKDKHFKNYEHDNGLIRLRILALEMDLGFWIPERMLRSVKPRGHSPDALLLTANAAYAVEYERTEKELVRYKQIFDRYDKSACEGVLYILPTPGRIEKLKKKLGYIWKKIYFISEEELFRKKENAVFLSSQNSLSLKYLIDYSRTGSLEGVAREELEKIIHREKPDAWRERKLYLESCRGRQRDEEDENPERASDSGFYPPMYSNEHQGFNEE